MILVVSPHPSTENQRDGMIQRIAHIDSLMASLPRTYLDISTRRFLRKQVLVEGSVTIYRLNLLVHFFKITRCFRQANLVYIHSAYNALKGCLIPTKAHVVFDSHGIVPEELLQERRPLSARIFAFAERQALRRCNTLVCVTRSMLEHFKAKYAHRADRGEIVFPILPHLGDTTEVNQALHATRTERSVIYAGGMQAWQNVDRMMFAAARRPEYNYTFLSGVADQFRVRLQSASIPRYFCDSVPTSAVKSYYLKNEFGFILRDRNQVNEVACPTKLVEYLYWGTVPIVISPNIGDFNETNLLAITLDDFESGKVPDKEALDYMRRANLSSVLSLIASAQHSELHLRELFRKGAR